MTVKILLGSRGQAALFEICVEFLQLIYVYLSLKISKLRYINSLVNKLTILSISSTCFWYSSSIFSNSSNLSNLASFSSFLQKTVFSRFYSQCSTHSSTVVGLWQQNRERICKKLNFSYMLCSFWWDILDCDKSFIQFFCALTKKTKEWKIRIQCPDNKWKKITIMIVVIWVE